MSSSGRPSSTSRWISLKMTATEDLYKSWYSCFRRYSQAAELASPAMTSTLKLYTYWRTFAKKIRTEPDAFIARTWWTWHTQQRILWRPDLVTNCLSLVSRRQSAVGTKLPLVSLSSMTKATDSRSLKSVSATRSRESVSDPPVFLPSFT